MRWEKKQNGKTMLTLDRLDAQRTSDQIEEEFNPRNTRGSQAQEKVDVIYSFFKENGEKETKKEKEVYSLTNNQFYGYADNNDISRKTAHRILRKTLKGFYTGVKKSGTNWHCPVNSKFE